VSSRTAAPVHRVAGGRLVQNGPAGEHARNHNIQYLRAVAASSVVVYHASFYLEKQRGNASFHDLFDGRFGLFGVSIFFAISGLLMARLVQRTDPWTFLSHRIIRIYPPFLVAVAFGFVLSRLSGVPFAYDNPPPNSTAVAHLFSLVLVPAGERAYPLGVEWTLVFETTFYVALTLVVWAKLQRYLVPLAAAWIAIILAAAWYTPSSRTDLLLPAHLILLSPANIAFAGGLLIPEFTKRGWLPAIGAALVVPAALVFDLLSAESNRLLSGIAAVFLVGWAAHGHKMGQFRSKFMLAAGDASYVLYLCHVPIIVALYKLLPATVESWVAWLIATGASFLVAALFGPLDVRLYRTLKGLTDRAAPNKVRRFALAYMIMFFALATLSSVGIIREERAESHVRASIRQLDLHTVTSPEDVAARLIKLGLRLPAFAGALESADMLPSGQTVIRGWALDLNDPTKRLRVRVHCGGEPIVPDVVSRRWRKDIAQTLRRPDLSKVRIGFALIFVQRPTCPDGTPFSVLAFDEDGKGALVPGPLRLSP
jgi:exopolysaccharide production protein ExoZ